MVHKCVYRMLEWWFINVVFRRSNDIIVMEFVFVTGFVLKFRERERERERESKTERSNQLQSIHH